MVNLENSPLLVDDRNEGGIIIHLLMRKEFQDEYEL